MRALVLSGGGSKGAFQVGALKYLIHMLGRKYTHFFGTSVGAINCAHLAMYSTDQQVLGVDGLVKLWSGLQDSQVKTSWVPFGVLSGLWKSSFYNTQPLRNLITSLVDLSRIHSAKNTLTVGVVSVETGEYRTFNERNPKIHDAILASSAFPGFFPPVYIDGVWYFDGGVRNPTPLKDAIDAGCDQIDVILTECDYSAAAHTPKTSYDMLLRALALLSHEVFEADIRTLLEKNSRVGKKKIDLTVIRPLTDLPVGLLKFVPEDSQKLIELGYEAAQQQKVAV